MIDVLTKNPAFGILLTIVAYNTALKIKNKTRSDLANPMLISLLIITAVLKGFNIPYERYKLGADAIHFLLGPLTVALGLMLYRQRAVIKKHAFSLLIGITGGVLASFFTIFFLGKHLQLDALHVAALLPKSITMPMALSLNSMIGGPSAITVVMVVLSGITGAFVAPWVIKWLPNYSAVSIGVGIGTAAHAVGTSKAIEIGETEGALSSTAIGLAGIITIILVPPLYALFT